MPMYEYRCESCGDTYEKLRRMEDADHDLKCPSCGSTDVLRQVSAFATSLSTDSGAACGPSSGGFS